MTSLAAVPLELRSDAAVQLVRVGVLEPEEALAAVVFGGDERVVKNSEEGTCKNGHPNDGNLFYDNRGWRRCRACGRESKMRSRLRKGMPHRGLVNGYCCIHGHPWTHENTYVRSNGWRVCRECARIAGRKYRADRA